MEYNIGERVRIREYKDIPPSAQDKGVAKNAGNDGEIIDKLWSAAKDCMVYRIRFDGVQYASKTLFVEGTFDRITDLLARISYEWEFEYLDNVVVAIFYEINEDSKKEIARGHGHIIHQGAEGIVQASAYAVKKAWAPLNGKGCKLC